MEQREHIYHYLPSNVHFGAVPSLCKREVFIVKLNLSLLSNAISLEKFHDLIV